MELRLKLWIGKSLIAAVGVLALLMGIMVNFDRIFGIG